VNVADNGITLDICSHVAPHIQSDAAEKIDAGLRAALAGWANWSATSRSALHPARCDLELPGRDGPASPPGTGLRCRVAAVDSGQ
jgi:hypothetical protein